MNLPGEPDEQKKKKSVRKTAKCHSDTQKELICSQSLDVLLSHSAPGTNSRFGCSFQMFAWQELGYLI